MPSEPLHIFGPRQKLQLQGFLSKRGVVWSLEPKRAARIAHHQAHGERVQAAEAAAKISTWFGFAAILLLAAFAWMVLR